MVFDQDFETLKILFTRSSALPNLRASSMKLVQRIDSGAPSAAELEKVIAADPALTAKILKAASSVIMARDGSGITTIRGAILHLGHQAVRSLAISLTVQGLITSVDPKSGFDTWRFARHSLFVGLFGSYLFRRRMMSSPLESEWSPEEVFAAGVLHDLPEALLHRVAPEVYCRVSLYSIRQQISFSNAFFRLFKNPLSGLGVLMMESWRLPTMFSTVLQYVDEPWLHQQEYTALSCINYADFLSEQSGFGKLPEPIGVTSLPDIQDEVALPQEEQVASIEAVGNRVEGLLNDCLNQAA